MINERLFTHYGIDTHKDLRIRNRCPRPFDTVLIDKQGSCYACECQSWLPQSIGNLQIKLLSEIIDDSVMRKHLQSSIKDGTYRYCNENQCSYIRANEVYEPNFQSTTPARIQHLRLAIDDSCNLRCPTCRKGMIFHKEGSAYELGIRLAEKIIDWLYHLKHPIQVHLGSDGDPFASHVYRYFMDHAPESDNIKYSILTNGLMFKDFHHRVPYVIGNLKELGVSIDGASKDTYERLRLGGNWEKINENLKCMAEMKQRHGFLLMLHFVVQKDNYHEMEEIIMLGKKYNADRIFLNKVEDWNVSDRFNDMNIFDHNHPLHEDYKEKLTGIKQYLGMEKKPIVEIPTFKYLV